MITRVTRRRWRSSLVGALFVMVLISLAGFALTVSNTQAQPPTASAAPVVASTEPYVEYAPNIALVKFKPGVTLASGEVNAAAALVGANTESLNGLLSALGATTASPIFARDGSVLAAQAGAASAAGLERIYRVQWSSTIPVDHAVAALAADPAVEYAEPDYIACAARIPNDPEYTSQWALPKATATGGVRRWPRDASPVDITIQTGVGKRPVNSAAAQQQRVDGLDDGVAWNGGSLAKVPAMA